MENAKVKITFYYGSYVYDSDENEGGRDWVVCGEEVVIINKRDLRGVSDYTIFAPKAYEGSDIKVGDIEEVE